MPSTCPKCRAVIEEDEVCCAQVRYSWRCKSCFKLTTGLAMPYGKCFLCGGDLEAIYDRDLGDSMRFRAIREAVQFELNSFHFYKLARDRASSPEQRAVLERLFEAELDHLHELEEKYHAHLERDVVELSRDEDKLLANWLFRGSRWARMRAWPNFTTPPWKWKNAPAITSASWPRNSPPAWSETSAPNWPPKRKST